MGTHSTFLGIVLLLLSACGETASDSAVHGLSFEDRLSKDWQLDFCNADSQLHLEDLNVGQTWACIHVAVRQRAMGRNSLNNVKFGMVDDSFVTFSRNGDSITERVGNNNVMYGPFENMGNEWRHVTGRYYFNNRVDATRRIRKASNGDLMIATSTTNQVYPTGQSFDPFCTSRFMAFWDIIRCSPN
ncbi:MAG: hypothetical protein AB7T49_14490 [Oligoflexales bacterium]